VTDCPALYTVCPPALLACQTHFPDGEDELALPAEWFNIMNIPEIVNVGDEGDMGIYPAGDSQFVGN